MGVVMLRRCAEAPQPKNLHDVWFEILGGANFAPLRMTSRAGVQSVCTWPSYANFALQSRQDDAPLRLVLPFFVLVADFAVFVALKEEHLAEPLVGVNLRGQWRGVADFQRDEPFPLRLKRRYVHDDPPARIGGFPQADRQHVARNPEILDRTSQREGIRRDQAGVALVVHQ